MQILELPHRTVDYLCPINGLCDIYEWKTGIRIPDELAYYVRAGFIMISRQNTASPKMIFMTNTNIGKQLFEYWQSHMGYHLIAAEGKTFRKTLGDIRSLVDRKIPVVLFGLDMYYLPYQEKFYHRLHIPGHVVLMVGYDEQAIYVHDNSKADVKRVSFADLQLAWQDDYLNISKKNAYFGIDFADQERDAKEIMKNAYSYTASQFINPPIGFGGIKGMDRLIKEFSGWQRSYDNETLRAIYTHFVMFTGSVLPGLPAKLGWGNPGINNPHHGLRDKLAAGLLEYCNQFGNESWARAAAHFENSGKIIAKIVDGFVEDIIGNSYGEAEQYLNLFGKLKESEERAYRSILSS